MNPKGGVDYVSEDGETRCSRRVSVLRVAPPTDARWGLLNLTASICDRICCVSYFHFIPATTVVNVTMRSTGPFKCQELTFKLFRGPRMSNALYDGFFLFFISSKKHFIVILETIFRCALPFTGTVSIAYTTYIKCSANILTLILYLFEWNYSQINIHYLNFVTT